MTVAEIIATMRSSAIEVPIEELPPIIGQLAALDAELRLRIAMHHSAPVAAHTLRDDERLLTASEAAERLGTTERWVRDHAHELPRVVLPGRTLRFSARRLAAFVERRTHASTNR